jgi:MFS family permease
MKNNIFRAFESKSFLFLWLGEIFTQISGNLFTFYLLIFAYELHKASTDVSRIVISFTVPAILFGVVAGAYVDRWEKKKVLYVINISRTVLLLFAAFFHGDFWILFVVSFLFSLFTQFFIPAESPIIPLLVTERQLLSANALFGLGLFGSILFAYVISGPLLLAFKETGSLLFLAFLQLMGAVFIYFIKIEKKEPIKTEETGNLSFQKELKHAFTVISRTRAIYQSLVILAMTQVLTLIIATLVPGYAVTVLNMPVEQFVFLFITPAAVGTVLGAVIIVNLLSRVVKETLVTIGIFLFGFAMFIMPYGSQIASREFVKDMNAILPSNLDITNLHIVVFLAFFIGIANALVFVPSNTLLQERTNEEVRGKAYGVLNTLVGLLSFLPILVAGGLADTFGVSKVIIGIGVVVLVLGFYRVAFGEK